MEFNEPEWELFPKYYSDKYQYLMKYFDVFVFLYYLFRIYMLI